MKYISAYLLSYINGNKSPSKPDVEGILSSAGIEVDSARLDLLFQSIESKGQDINSLIKEGMGQI